eukprot:7004309-Prymnesium_polylepis.1
MNGCVRLWCDAMSSVVEPNRDPRGRCLGTCQDSSVAARAAHTRMNACLAHRFLQVSVRMRSFGRA